jgi:hypothetical protein
MKSVKQIIFYSLILSLFPLTTKTGTPIGVLVFFLTVLSFGVIGAVSLQQIVKEDDHLNAILYILLGGVLIQFISAISWYIFPVIIASTCVYSFYYILKHRNQLAGIQLSSDVIIFLLIAFLFLYIGKDPKEANSFHVIHPTIDDNYYFSALTESLIKGSYWNSFFDTGAPLNYQITAFLLPANFAKLTNLTGHISFWAYAMPFYKLISILTFGFCIRRLVQIKGVQPAFILTITGLLLFTFSSLNIVNLLRIKWSSLVFFAAGNFWPGGSPSMTLGFALMCATVFLVLRSYTMKHLVLAGLCTIAIILTKIAMWLPTISFLGIYALLQGLKKTNRKNLILISLASVTACVLYVIFYTKDASSKFAIEPFAELQNTILRTFKFDTANPLKLVMFFAIYLLLSFGIRIIFLAMPFFNKKLKEYKTTSLATIFAVVVSSLLMLPFKIYFYDLQGNIVYDSSYNLEQFLRSAYILVMFTSIYLLFICFKQWQSRLRIIATFTILVYCSLIAYGNFTFYSRAETAVRNINNNWRSSVRQYFQGLPNKNYLLCMVGNSLDNKAHDLVADGIGPWWYSGKTNDGSVAYFFSTRNNKERIPVVDSLSAGLNKALSLSVLKQHKVTHLVVASSFTPVADSLVNAGLLLRTTNNFVYTIK